MTMSWQRCVVSVVLAASTTWAQLPATPVHAPKIEGELEGLTLERLKRTEEARGVYSAAFSAATLSAAAAERARAPEGHTRWKSVGPVKDDFLQNGDALVREIDSGRVRTILVNPYNADEVYVLAAGGGLWRTRHFSNPNADWEPLSDRVGSTAGGNVAFGRTPNVLHLGTGDPFDIGVGGFMVRSTNGGESWSAPVFLGGATKVLDVKVDSSGAGEVVLVGTNAGLFRSSNGGASYAPISALGPALVWSLVKTNTGWLASVQEADGSIASGGTTTLYRSSDRGATWTVAGAGFPTTATRTTLAVATPGDPTVYAFASTLDASGNFVQLDLFRSRDGGQTFSALGITTKVPSNPNEDTPTMDLMAGQAWYNQMVLVDPTDAQRNTVYLGGQLAVAKTTDGGQTWRVLSHWLSEFSLPYVHADFHTATFANGRLYLGTDGGLFFSDNGGATFSSARNKGLTTHLVYAVASSPSQPQQTLVGLQDNGTRYRVPGTKTYNQVIGGDGFGVAWSQANDAVSMGSLYFNSLFRCTTNPPDDTSKFEFAANDIVDYTFNFFTPLTTPLASSDPSGQVFFTYSPTFVYKTTTGGASWQILGNIDEGNGYALSNIHAGAPFSTFFRNVVHGMGVSPDLKHVGVVATASQVALTNDDGATWSVPRLSTLVPGYQGFNSNVLWTTNSTVFVASLAPDAAAVHVVKSTDGGATWAPAETGLPHVPVNKLVVHPGNPQIIFAATLLGVYRTRDGGASWAPFGKGLPQMYVTDLEVSPDGKRLKAATWGRGVWEAKLPRLSDDDCDGDERD